MPHVYNKHKMDVKSYMARYRSSNSYTSRADKTITQIGFLLPYSLLAYGLLIQFGIVKSINNNVDLVGFSIIMLFWILIGIAQKLKPGNTAVRSTIRLIEFHAMSGVYFLFISGVFNPFTACWPILMIASYTYFDKIGLRNNILAFFVIIAIDITAFHPGNISVMITDLVVFIAAVITGLVVIAVNRTHEVRREKLFESVVKESLQRDQIATIVNNLADAVISTDPNGIIRVHNAASLDLLDTNANLDGKDIDDILALTDSNDNEISVLSVLRQSISVVRRDDLFYIFSDGEKIRLSITFAPIRNGYSKTHKEETNDGYILIMRDITKEKSLEEERDEFISVVSHELRTPITIAEGTISNLQAMMKRPDISDSMLADSLGVAHDQVLFLATMVNDLSALSRAENDKSESTDDIDVQELAQDLLIRYSDEAKKKKLKLDLNAEPNLGIIRVNRLYIEELLQNLVTNAIKYTQTGGITISVEKKNKNIILSVKDTGIGISKTDQQKIFDKFYRSKDYRIRESSGTGLGLYVAAKLAKKLGTSIKLVSRLNYGSSFSIVLPEATRSDTKINKVTPNE